MKKESKEKTIGERAMLACGVVTFMEGRARPRLNINNPLMYVWLLVMILVAWFWEIVRVVGEGFYNVVAIYISTIRAGYEDAEVVKLMESMKRNKQEFIKYGGVIKDDHSQDDVKYGSRNNSNLREFYKANNSKH